MNWQPLTTDTPEPTASFVLAASDDVYYPHLYRRRDREWYEFGADYMNVMPWSSIRDSFHKFTHYVAFEMPEKESPDET